MLYEIFDKYKCTLNIDRVKFWENNINKDINALSVGYHLDKEHKKSGGVFFFNIDDKTNKIKAIESENILLDYGILDIKFNEDKTVFYTANSDYSYSILNMKNKNIEKILLDANKNQETSNILETNLQQNQIILGTNDGIIHIQDLSTNKNILKIKAHDYGIWSLHLLKTNNNLLLSGSEDSLLKLWDIREKTVSKPISINKSYTSSINCIDELNFNDNLILTGSYDNKLIIFDIRNFPSELKSTRTEHITWDFKQAKYNNKNLIFTVCSHDGFNIYNIDEANLELKNINSLKIDSKIENFHESIIYGLDIKTKANYINILSCSLYDNLLVNWKIF